LARTAQVPPGVSFKATAALFACMSRARGVW